MYLFQNLTNKFFLQIPNNRVCIYLLSCVIYIFLS
nr:MAG TPA: RPN1/RPN2 N-terminal domain [Caudoviricetes sp.]